MLTPRRRGSNVREGILEHATALVCDVLIAALIVFIHGVRRRLRKGGSTSLEVPGLTTTKEEENMEKKIELGKEAGLKLELVEGKLKVAVALDTAGVDAELAILVEPQYFADKLKAAISGQVDDVVIDILMGALKKA